MLASAQFAKTIAENVDDGKNHYGDIDLAVDLFVMYVWDISCKHMKDWSNEFAVIDFARRLYLRDLYLTCGCVQKSEKAWESFDLRYRRFVSDLVHFCYRQGADKE